VRMVVRDVTQPTFGRRLKELREAAGMTQEQLGGMIYKNKSQISRLENEQARPSANDAELLDTALRTTPILTELVANEPAVPQRTRKRRTVEPRSELPPAPAHLLGRQREVATIINRLRPDPATGSSRSVRVCLISASQASERPLSLPLRPTAYVSISRTVSSTSIFTAI